MNSVSLQNLVRRVVSSLLTFSSSASSCCWVTAAIVLGVDLHVLDGGDFHGSVTALEHFVAEQGVTEVFCNREYPLNELNRDRAVARRLGLRTHQRFPSSALGCRCAGAT